MPKRVIMKNFRALSDRILCWTFGKRCPTCPAYLAIFCQHGEYQEFRILPETCWLTRVIMFMYFMICQSYNKSLWKDTSLKIHSLSLSQVDSALGQMPLLLVGREIHVEQSVKRYTWCSKHQRRIHFGVWQINKHCRARSCIWPRPHDPDFYLSMSDLLGIYQTGVTWRD